MRWIWLVVGLTACGGGVERSFVMQHYQVPCLGEGGLQLCRLAKIDGLSTDERIFDEISGWTFTWGELATLTVIESQRLSSQERETVWRLGEVISTEPVEPGVVFQYPFRPSEESDDVKAVVTEDGGGRLLDGRAFTCEDALICEDLGNVVGSRETVVLTFQYDDPITSPLILTQVDVVGT